MYVTNAGKMRQRNRPSTGRSEAGSKLARSKTSVRKSDAGRRVASNTHTKYRPIESEPEPGAHPRGRSLRCTGQSGQHGRRSYACGPGGPSRAPGQPTAKGQRDLEERPRCRARSKISAGVEAALLLARVLRHLREKRSARL